MKSPCVGRPFRYRLNLLMSSLRASIDRDWASTAEDRSRPLEIVFISSNKDMCLLSGVSHATGPSSHAVSMLLKRLSNRGSNLGSDFLCCSIFYTVLTTFANLWRQRVCRGSSSNQVVDYMATFSNSRILKPISSIAY
jgi:hypothetical protein